LSSKHVQKYAKAIASRIQPFENLNAAIKVQRAWRRSFKHIATHQLVEKFASKGPTVEHVKSIR
jgi:hypothetical protein